MRSNRSSTKDSFSDIKLTKKHLLVVCFLKSHCHEDMLRLCDWNILAESRKHFFWYILWDPGVVQLPRCFPIRTYHGIAAPDGRDAPHTSTSFRPRGGDYHQPGAKRCCCCFGNAGHEIRMCLCTVYHFVTLIYIYIYYIYIFIYLFIYNQPWLQETQGDSPCPLVHDFWTTRSTGSDVIFLLGSVGRKVAKWLTTPIFTAVVTRLLTMDHWYCW